MKHAFTLSCFLFSLRLLHPNVTLAEVRDDYELTVDVAVRAVAGWELYLDEKYAGDFKDGHYTDPEPNSLGKEFWSNGKKAKFDRDHNGHHETIFSVQDNKLVYVGSIGGKGKWIDQARDAKKFAEVFKEFAPGKDEAGDYIDGDEKAEDNKERLTDAGTIKRAEEGWRLYKNKQFAGQWRDGQYTNPEPETPLKEFWSNDLIAKFDRDGNGHHESIFFVTKQQQIEYVGKLGGRGKFTDVEKKFRKFKGKSLSDFERVARTVKKRG